MKCISSILIFFAITANLESQTRIDLQIDASVAVDYIVTNPAGKQSGIDARVVDKSGEPVLLHEIPNAGYGYMSVGKSDPKDETSESTEFNAGFLSPQGDGVYQIDLIGNKLASFNIYLTLSSHDTTRAQDAQFSILDAPIDKDSVVTYLFTYHEAPGSPVSFTKVVSVTSLIQDVTVMRKFGWIKNQAAADKYVNYFCSIKLQASANNFNGARAILQTVLSDAKNDRTRKKLTSKAFKLIHSDTAT
jgi:hypothetical protein